MKTSPISSECHDGVESAVALFDAGEDMAEQLSAGKCPVPDSPGQLSGRGVIEIHARTVPVFTALPPTPPRSGDQVQSRAGVCPWLPSCRLAGSAIDGPPDGKNQASDE
jgi:hypothetical protein